MKCIKCDKDIENCTCVIEFVNYEKLSIEVGLLCMEKRTYLTKFAIAQKKIKELEEELNKYKELAERLRRKEE